MTELLAGMLHTAHSDPASAHRLRVWSMGVHHGAHSVRRTEISTITHCCSFHLLGPRRVWQGQCSAILHMVVPWVIEQWVMYPNGHVSDGHVSRQTQPTFPVSQHSHAHALRLNRKWITHLRPAWSLPTTYHENSYTCCLLLAG